MKDYIAFYKRLGFSFIPLTWKCKTPSWGDLPRDGEGRPVWEPYRSRVPTEEEVERWFFGASAKNVAVITGSVSGNLAVLDFESPEAYHEFFSKREELERRTLVAQTGRGYHVYLRAANPPRSGKADAVGLEVKGEGGYVVAPPSIHPSGRQYNFLSSELEEAKVLEVSGLEESVVRRIEEVGGSFKALDAPSSGKRRSLFKEVPPCIEALVNNGVKEGKRKVVSLQIASFFINSYGMNPNRVLERLKEWNKVNRPPLPEKEILETWRYAQRGYVYSCRHFADVCRPAACPLYNSPVYR